MDFPLPTDTTVPAPDSGGFFGGLTTALANPYVQAGLQAGLSALSAPPGTSRLGAIARGGIAGLNTIIQAPYLKAQTQRAQADAVKTGMETQALAAKQKMRDYFLSDPNTSDFDRAEAAADLEKFIARKQVARNNANISSALEQMATEEKDPLVANQYKEKAELMKFYGEKVPFKELFSGLTPYQISMINLRKQGLDAQQQRDMLRLDLTASHYADMKQLGQQREAREARQGEERLRQGDTKITNQEAYRDFTKSATIARDEEKRSQDSFNRDMAVRKQDAAESKTTKQEDQRDRQLAIGEKRNEIAEARVRNQVLGHLETMENQKGMMRRALEKWGWMSTPTDQALAGLKADLKASGASDQAATQAITTLVQSRMPGAKPAQGQPTAGKSAPQLDLSQIPQQPGTYIDRAAGVKAIRHEDGTVEQVPLQ